jgi:hypothetical protein
MARIGITDTNDDLETEASQALPMLRSPWPTMTPTSRGAIRTIRASPTYYHSSATARLGSMRCVVDVSSPSARRAGFTSTGPPRPTP